MIFQDLTLLETGELQAVAEGHPTDVVEAFHSVCSALLSGKGAWRMTEIHGVCSDEETLDSKMVWTLHAKLKEPS